MTALTAPPPPVMASEPSLSASPSPQPGIKTHSPPAAFPTTLSIAFPPVFPFLHRPPSCLRPRRAPITSCGPLTPTERYDATSQENVSARLPALIRSTPRQHCLHRPSDHASTCDNDADEAPDVPAGHRRPGHAKTLDAGPLLPLLQASSLNSLNLLASPPVSTKAALEC